MNREESRRWRVEGGAKKPSKIKSGSRESVYGT
jgi:hypothetical protein